MSEVLSAADAAVVQRRRFLRGGALLAAAAGGAVAAGATSALPAAAATGDSLTLGAANAATATTSLEADGAAQAALALTNTKGPSLQLVSVGLSVPDYDGLPLGSVVNTDDGPFISVDDDEGGTFLSYLATGEDLVTVPSSRAFTPKRVWDSKAKKGTVVAKSSAKAVDAQGRLVKGEWVDVKVADTDLDTFPIAAFLTVGSSGSKKDGYLNVWASGNRPSGTVSVSFLKGKSLSGAAFAQLALNRGKKAFTVRVYASQTTSVSVDLSGLTSYGYPGPDFAEPDGRSAGAASRRAATKAERRALR